MEDVLIVAKFFDVFFKDLPEMPPKREIEFIEEVIHGMAPIFKEPYKMALTQLNELKE